MEDNAISNGTAQGFAALSSGNSMEKEKDGGIYSRANTARIQTWRASILNLNSHNPSSTPSSFQQLLSPNSTKDSLDSDNILADTVELDQFLSHSVSPSSFRTTIKDSGTPFELSDGLCGGNVGSSSPESFPSTTPLSVDIPECALLSPRSCYEGFKSPDGISIMSEWRALQTLSPALDEATADQGAQGFAEMRLDDFAIYLDTDKFAEEMRSLHQLDTKIGHSSFFFDGILSIGDSRAYVRRVPVAAVPIGNYGSLSIHTVKGHIWIQSHLNSKKALFYKLGKPAKEYARFFYPFLWVADLAKHFVDFLCIMAESRRNVSIHHFRSTFAAWLKKSHKGAPEFLEWLRQHPSGDYRTSIAANIRFLLKEALGVLGHHKTYIHTIWAEVLEFQLYKSQPKIVNPPTIVTRYIYGCFEHLPFGDRLQVIPLSSETTRLRNDLIRQRHLELASKLHQSTKNLTSATQQRIKSIQPGDTISTHRDDAGSGTLWKRELPRGFPDVDVWFALVQSVHINKMGVRTFNVIWYYRPVDTLCGLMKYPWNNELFLSDHCSCSETSKINESEILGVHDVEFWGTSATNAELFCRQTYLQEERRWVTLEERHLRCRHTSPRPEESPLLLYETGKTYLLRLDSTSPISEPCELMTSFREGRRRIYRFRRLLRRQQVDPNTPNARPNELVYSEQSVEIKIDQILGPCSVRFFRDGDEIPTPYDRDGTGNHFYITHQQIFIDGASVCVPLNEAPASLRQGYDPHERLEKLRGIDLFCGGGNFGRGLEDGGGIEMKWANDYDSKAIHTYMANVNNPEDVHPFLGSIDDLQRFAMQGRFAKNVPQIGHVDFVAGGSPCPGFSSLTNDKTTAAQRKNQSLVAAFASFVDLYRPKYGVLENVPGMVHKKEARDEDVFSQLICALVGLGYQTQFFFLDASSCGSPQRRSRIFVVFAAPGLELPKKPMQTHSHPPNTREIGIGWLPNGQHMATREMPEATPFKYVSAEEATSNLPSIHDAQPDICIPYPDHRTTRALTKSLRTRISAIPVRPWGMNFAKAWYGEDRARAGSGKMTAAERELFVGTNDVTGTSKQPMATQPRSKSYGRIFPNTLFDTIVTSQTPGDAKNGRLLHWRENRLITVMEARRAQGFRDEEVLLGDPITQYRIVGNSVARDVAVALGVTFRDAWVASLQRHKGLELRGRCVEEEAKLIVDGPDIYEPTNLDIGTDMSTSQSRSLSPTPHASRPSTPLTLVDDMRVSGGASAQQAGLSAGHKRPYLTTLVVEIPKSLKRPRLGVT
ncbi:hypothetical protein V8C37DRAFT_370711 [Trichoderma ceciliae]